MTHRRTQHLGPAIDAIVAGGVAAVATVSILPTLPALSVGVEGWLGVGLTAATVAGVVGGVVLSATIIAGVAAGTLNWSWPTIAPTGLGGLAGTVVGVGLLWRDAQLSMTVGADDQTMVLAAVAFQSLWFLGFILGPPTLEPGDQSAADSDTTSHRHAADQQHWTREPPRDDGPARSNDREATTPETDYHWETDPGVSFQDVGGCTDLKADLKRDVIGPIHRREELRDRGLELTPPNVLFHGPPGTGKTHMARALAAELGMPFTEVSAGQILSKWVNESPRRINQLFEEATAMAAEHGAAVVFIDEIDAMLSARDGRNQHREDEKTVGQFLSCLQETDDGVLIIGATNRRNALDDAAIRRGRFDRHIEIGPPDHETRAAILRTHLADVPHELTDRYIDRLAAATEGAVASDLAALIEDAQRIAFFDREGDAIRMTDIEAANK